MLQKARSSWNCKSLGGWEGADAEHRDVGLFLLQTADEWQNLLSELIKAPSRELMAYTIASKRKFFHSHDCKLDHTGLHKHIAFSKITCSGKDGLAIHFIYNIIHVLMPFSQIIPTSLSHRIQKTVPYICVSFVQGYCGVGRGLSGHH